MRPRFLCDSLPDNATIPGGTGHDPWPTLLVVDSDPHMLHTLACYFEKRGFHVAAAATIAEAKTYFYRHKTWTLVVADYHLPDGTGWELCSWLREQVRPPPCLLMSGSVQGAELCDGVDFLAKPFAIGELENRVRALLPRGTA
jgi:DNA-binding response OmpR family regulator